MTTNKDSLIAELKEELRALKVLQDSNPDAIRYLSTDLKAIVKEATKLVSSENSVDHTAESTSKPKGKCEKMLANWKKYIMTPFKADVDKLLAMKLKRGAINKQLDALCTKYYNLYSKKRWFDPNNPKQGTYGQHYIDAHVIPWNFEFRRDVNIVKDVGPVEVPSSYSGPLKGPTNSVIQIGEKDVIQIKTPKARFDNEFTAGGVFEYELNAIKEADTFKVWGSTGGELENQKVGIDSDELDKKKSKEDEKIKDEDIKIKKEASFGEVGDYLFIDVEESRKKGATISSSIWTATINLNFVRVTFKIPKCMGKQHPCPKW